MPWPRRRGAPLRRETLGAGVVLRGHLWCGDDREHSDGRVVVGADGTVAAAGAAGDVDPPYGALEVDGVWVGPGLQDAHVHLAFGDPGAFPATGVVAVRDLGAPPVDALRWQALDVPRVEVAGPLLTAPGGYPSRGWGRDGFAAFVDDRAQASRLVSGLAATVDVVKLALEPAGGPVPAPDVCAAVVEAAHAAGRRVTAHALSSSMVERALTAGVDELAHTPTERLPDDVVDEIGRRGLVVVSTLQTFVRSGTGRPALANAHRLVAAGARLRYGTDLGNAGTRSGADLRELELLATAVGLGSEGAVRAATQPIVAGDAAGVVVLDDDPRRRPSAWREPRAVVVGSTLLLRP